MLSVFTVFDVKVGAYLPPIFLRSKGEALRVFSSTVNTPDHEFAKNPQDFTIFELGTFDEQKAKFDLHLTPIPLGVAVEFLKSDV